MDKNVENTEEGPFEQEIITDNTESDTNKDENKNSDYNVSKKSIAFILIITSSIWLLNFTFGVFELPDNLPIFGNMDEAVAAGVLFSALRYLGYDIYPWVNKIMDILTKYKIKKKSQKDSKSESKL